MNMNLEWEKFDKSNAEMALSRNYCLYVFHHPENERPYYIGKAKYFGKEQPNGRENSARYNGSYEHLVIGMLLSGFNLYISHIGEEAFEYATDYEQALIAKWNPTRDQERRNYIVRELETKIPWQIS